jgi:hypothetical protein
MKVVISWWDLTGSDQTIESLREYLLGESWEAWGKVAGLRLKLWVVDRETNRWGAVMLWESAEAAEGPTPSRVTELVGYPPTQRLVFDLEASVQGRYEIEQLSGLGLAFAAERA